MHNQSPLPPPAPCGAPPNPAFSARFGFCLPSWAAFLRHPPPVLYHLHDFGTEFLRKGREGKEKSRRKGKNERKWGRRHMEEERKGHLQYFSFPCLGRTFAVSYDILSHQNNTYMAQCPHLATSPFLSLPPDCPPVHPSCPQPSWNQVQSGCSRPSSLSASSRSQCLKGMENFNFFAEERRKSTDSGHLI